MINAPEHDRLAAGLLGEIDRANDESRSSSDHPDEETIAQFALGELRGSERDELVRHLSECPECRRTASAALSWSGISESAPSQRTGFKPGWSLKRPGAWVGLAAAACVLVILGVLVRSNVRIRPSAATEAETYAQAAELLERGQFDEARSLVTAAAGRGIESDRLRSIEAQSLRRMSGLLALAYAGKLTDFGFEIGGAVARSTAAGQGARQAEEALKVLAPAQSDDATAALNRAHALLSLGRPREALAEFQRVAAHEPGSTLARLGEGLARYALADYPAAEAAFRECLRIDPDQAAARMNLAMTLAEEGKIDEALAAWAQVLARPSALSAQERVAVENEVEQLRQARQRPTSPAPTERRPEGR